MYVCIHNNMSSRVHTVCTYKKQKQMMCFGCDFAANNSIEPNADLCFSHRNPSAWWFEYQAQWQYLILERILPPPRVVNIWRHMLRMHCSVAYPRPGIFLHDVNEVVVEGSNLFRCRIVVLVEFIEIRWTDASIDPFLGFQMLYKISRSGEVLVLPWTPFTAVAWSPTGPALHSWVYHLEPLWCH